MSLVGLEHLGLMVSLADLVSDSLHVDIAHCLLKQEEKHFLVSNHTFKEVHHY